MHFIDYPFNYIWSHCDGIRHVCNIVASDEHRIMLLLPLMLMLLLWRRRQRQMFTPSPSRSRRPSLSHCVCGSVVCSSRGQSDSFIRLATARSQANINVDYMPTVCT